jgi:putative flippase GtrA
MFRVLSRQLLLFLVVGAAQVLLDWATFVLLTHFGVAVAVGNFIGRVCGACLGYWLNGRYTFAGADGRPRLGPKQLRRFIVAWLGITALSTFLVWSVAGRFSLEMAWLAKPAVEGLMAAIGFVVWRQWVYR